LKTWIKFCGTTSLEDALASVEAGADALGFIFASSKRRITPGKAQAIIAGLPASVERIGVFVDDAAEKILDIVIEAGLTGVQLHGSNLMPEILSYFPRHGRDSMRIIRTVFVDEGLSHVNDRDFAAAGPLRAWLLDSGAGSGRTFDWRACRDELGDRHGRFIIAGGLNPENVGEAMRIFMPWGVDVVSGIEREPGSKDKEKMKAFVAAVRKAEQQ
jgi:phosphoribosylanthranilate isomerase